MTAKAADLFALCGEAAVAGYYIPDEEAAEVRDEGEETELFGDDGMLSEQQRQVVMLLKESSLYSRIKLKRVALSFSGASVFFFSPHRKDGTPMPPSVLKLDTAKGVKDEVKKTKKYASLYGLATPKVKDVQFIPDAAAEDPCAVMQIDLCGGVFGLPEFSSAAPVQTFASVIEQELESGGGHVDLMPLINEALERRMHAFTMSGRSVKRVDLAAMYKLSRFVGHGVLDRAKEGAKRAQTSPALAVGFQNPPDVDDLDPSGKYLQELSGTRKTAKEFFSSFVALESKMKPMLEREVVCGLCHNDLHGGNLLLDSQGLVWLIDFATVKDNVHVLMDLTKFLASCLFLYFKQSVSEEPLQVLAKLLAATPDATTALPIVGGEQFSNNVVVRTLVELLTRLRHCMCIYEVGEDAPSNDGVPFALALFSWSTRMLSYSEPSLHQKGRALYYAMTFAHRLLWEAGVDNGPVANEWIEEFRMIWEGGDLYSTIRASAMP
jgi:hypothetical protein